ncbi:MAG: galactose-1-phosphate uridylyltransferase [bacterium]|nr:galactose-1-phosphate uridylyltransferase [bacterium]
MVKDFSKKAKFPSELRFDPVSKDWILIATGRARRPETFAKEKQKGGEKKKAISSLKNCPFCNFEKEKSILEYKNKNGLTAGRTVDWFVKVIPNKFPAFLINTGLNKRKDGPYTVMDGVGFAEVVVTRDHARSMAQFSVSEIRLLFDAYQERYLDLMNEKFVDYVSIFHNHGHEAGASIEHPHSQIITHPIIDPDLRRSLNGSADYWEKNKKCIHCVMLDWDRKDKQRIVFENKEFVVLCPFTSRVAFETRIYPKNHHAYFERIEDREKDYLAEAFRVAFLKLYKALGDPPYNFFLHTSPCDGRNYDHYHWHIEILPKTSTWAGFELGTGIEISTIEPEKAAEYLRKM